ncbi:MAG: cupin [Actinomycetes bacterium]|jgi:quercetin dioxygenase-like cupin family protein
MPQFITAPAHVPIFGGKTIDEYVGRVTTGDTAVSIAYMVAPAGWSEPGKAEDFDEYTLVIKGVLRVDHEGGYTDVSAGQAIICRAGEHMRYESPEGAEYVAVCLPAFGNPLVHLDDDTASA